ncbi:DUF485 domain-containing protein [Paenibacillus allorhizosphaerae]|uniref:DUF485 domain-containing protein n=1 Tax=Paenibacillus allorhizosphaerae TaxID=2849866 RepID=A0ABN7TSN2_9BACL|nr:DUF485 domain-containing protein [Paenibacillus allorhizosphaerae]CAG7647688.1 hypothetical protein PAECIP111802_04040 [Paenibacillus allorhizosphaerae]
MKAKAWSYASIARSTSFQRLMARKKRFLLPMSVFFFAYYFALPILTSYTIILNTPAIGPISWAWVFAFSQFIMTWALCMIYSSKSKAYDAMIEDIRKELN